MKTAERDMARALRAREGRSIREIAELVGVSRASVSVWVRDIELTAAQHSALLDRNPAYNRQRSGVAKHAALCRRLRSVAQEHGRALAQIGDAFHSAGCMLYWAEGDKSRNQVSFSNSDSCMVAFFLEFLQIYYGISDRDVRIACHLYADHEARQAEVEDFWLSTLGLPRSCLNKSMVNRRPRSSQQKRVNFLPYGTCKLRVCRTHIVQSIWGSIQEYGRFERPEWLG